MLSEMQLNWLRQITFFKLGNIVHDLILTDSIILCYSFHYLTISLLILSFISLYIILSFFLFSFFCFIPNLGNAFSSSYYVFTFNSLYLYFLVSVWLSYLNLSSTYYLIILWKLISVLSWALHYSLTFQKSTNICIQIF